MNTAINRRFSAVQIITAYPKFHPNNTLFPPNFLPNQLQVPVFEVLYSVLTPKIPKTFPVNPNALYFNIKCDAQIASHAVSSIPRILIIPLKTDRRLHLNKRKDCTATDDSGRLWW
jgi:hypothetical protein